jgi:ankyrin repeat protein
MMKEVWAACEANDEVAVRVLIKESGAALVGIDDRNHEGHTAVTWCCTMGFDTVLRALVGKRKDGGGGADIETGGILVGSRPGLPLEIASRKGHLSCCEVLLAAGAAVNAKDARYDGGQGGPLYHAALGGHDSVCKLLLLHRADVNQSDYYASPLWIAAKEGHEKVCKSLLLYKADVNQVNKLEKHVTPLWVAAENGNDKAAEVLLSFNADVNMSHEDGSSPLSIAAEKGHDKMVALLLLHKADVNLKDRYSRYPLWNAASSGYDKVVKVLLMHKADVDDMHDCYSPLLIAVSRDHEKVVKLLLSHNADVNLAGKGEDAWRPLHKAACSGNEKLVALLLSYGADTGPAVYVTGWSKPKIGKTPLQIAQQVSKHAVVDLLMKHEHDMKSTDFYGLKGSYPAKFAAIRGKVDELEGVLAEFEGHSSAKHIFNEMSEKQFEGRSPVMLAAKFGRSEALEFMLNKGADVDQTHQYNGYFLVNDKYRSPLIFAALGGHLDCLKILVNHGADYKAVTREHKESPLFCAASLARVDCMRYLMSLPGLETAAVRPDIHGDTVLSLYLKSGMIPEEEMVLQLLEMDLPFHKDGATNSTHCDSWTLVLDIATSAISESVCLSLVQSVFAKHPGIVRQLAFAQDSFGRMAINITHRSVSQFMGSQIFFCGRYELQEGPPIHRSATAVVMYARDHGVVEEYKATFARVCGASGSLSVQAFTALRAEMAISYQANPEMQRLSAEEVFRQFDRNNHGCLTIDEFLHCCYFSYGKERRVVLKFMRNEGQFLQEKAVRSVGGGLDPRYILRLLEGPSDEEFRAKVKDIVLFDG